jgi:spermidine/putrescine transport system substrate-binding protein
MPLHRWNRRQFLQAGTATAATVVLGSCQQGNQSGKSPLQIYTWSTYIDRDLTDEFTRRSGIPVVVDTYDSNEAMLAKLQAGGGSAYSLIYPSDYMVSQMRDLNLLLPLDQEKLPGLRGLAPRFQNATFDLGNRYSVPLYWGTTGLAYNQKLITQPITDWDDLWDRQAQLNQKFTLINDARETLGASLKRLGFSYNAKDLNQLTDAYNALVELKPAIASFITDAWKDQLLADDYWLVMAYSSDAAQVLAENPDLVYVVPKSGASFWIDTMAIPKSAPNVAAAYQWMAMMLEPKVAAGATERLKVATSVEGARDLLPEALRNNTTLFPAEEVLDRCESITTLPEPVAETFDRYWTQLTSG